MTFRDPWIDPRILEVTPSAAQAYLRGHGWQLLGPASDPNLLLFDAPAGGEESPLAAVPLVAQDGAGVQRMIDLVADIARYEKRYAGDVLTDILRPASTNGVFLTSTAPRPASAVS